MARSIVCAAGDRRLLIVGELHGTNETPDLTAELVRVELAGHPVRLGIEFPVAQQAAVTTFVRSAGTDADRTKLLRGEFWKTRDGRSSAAMLRLLEMVRAERAKGADLDVFTMEPSYADHAAVERAGGAQAFKEAGMADAIHAAINAATAQTTVIALMGNYHARYDATLPRDGSVTARVAASAPSVVLPFAHVTDAWNCMADGCAVHSYTSKHAPAGTLPRLVTDVSGSATAPTVVKLWLSTMSAALPANLAGPQN